MPKSSALNSLIEKEKLDLQQRKSHGEETGASLCELILFKKSPAGLSLPERDLADALVISRKPTHGGMRALTTEGLINYTATRQPYVANPSLEKLAQNLAVIGILEALGELACPNAHDKDLSHNIALNDLMKQATYRDEPLEFFRTDMKCDTAIVAASGNTPLVETQRQYNNQLCQARFVSSRMRISRIDTLQQLQDIASALTNRYTEATFAAVGSHLEFAIEHLTKVLNDQKRMKKVNETTYWNNSG